MCTQEGITSKENVARQGKTVGHFCLVWLGGPHNDVTLPIISQNNDNLVYRDPDVEYFSESIIRSEFRDSKNSNRFFLRVVELQDIVVKVSRLNDPNAQFFDF